MVAPKTMRTALAPLLIGIGGALVAWQAFGYVPLRAAVGLELGNRRVDRRPFDVPRLHDSGSETWGRAIGYEELERRVGQSKLLNTGQPDDLEHLVAIDPKRGLAFASKTLTERLERGWGDAYRGWDSQVAGLDDAWACDHRRVVLDRALGDRDPTDRQRILAREVTEDLTAVPVEGRFTGDTWLQRFWNEHRAIGEQGGAEPISSELRVPQSKVAPKSWPLGDLVMGWRTADEVTRAFADAPDGAGRTELAKVASLRYPELTPAAREGLVRVQAATPAPFAETAIGRLLEDLTSPAAVRRPLTPDLGRGLAPRDYAGAWELAAPARRSELRAHALATLTEKGLTYELAELLRHDRTDSPETAELRRTLRRAYWERRDISALIADGDASALDFARRWGADGNPAHEVDAAGLSGLPQADAITAPLLRSHASEARAAMLVGLAGRRDPEAMRRLRLLARDPARRVSYAATRVLANRAAESSER